MHLLLRLLPTVLLGVFAGPTATPADWTTYQATPGRSGVASGVAPFAGLQRRFSRALDGQLYGQPLIAGGRVYVATENNSVYAFTASGQRLFRRSLGAPVPGRDLPCGNIDPSGITSTPVIAGSRLYVVAFLRRGHRHVLFGIDTRTGSIVLSRRVDPAHRLAQQQRGALLFAHGRIYIPYGGLYGDCGSYHGVVISVTASGQGFREYRNPSGQAGIWSPGGIAEEPGGDLLVATGNGSGPGFGYANSVIRLSPGLGRLADWAPRNWRSLSGSDSDIGSLSPAPLPGGRVFQAGKDGYGYLLPSRLGGIGAQLFGQHICGGAYGAAAVAPPLVIVPCLNALVAVRVSGNRFSVAWRRRGRAGPPIVAGSSVVYLAGDAGRLRVLRLTDGSEQGGAAVADGQAAFPSPAAAGDVLAAPSGRTLIVWRGL